MRHFPITSLRPTANAGAAVMALRPDENTGLPRAAEALKLITTRTLRALAARVAPLSLFERAQRPLMIAARELSNFNSTAYVYRRPTPG